MLLATLITAGLVPFPFLPSVVLLERTYNWNLSNYRFFSFMVHLIFLISAFIFISTYLLCTMVSLWWYLHACIQCIFTTWILLSSPVSLPPPTLLLLIHSLFPLVGSFPFLPFVLLSFHLICFDYPLDFFSIAQRIMSRGAGYKVKDILLTITPLKKMFLPSPSKCLLWIYFYNE